MFGINKGYYTQKGQKVICMTPNVTLRLNGAQSLHDKPKLQKALIVENGKLNFQWVNPENLRRKTTGDRRYRKLNKSQIRRLNIHGL